MFLSIWNPRSNDPCAVENWTPIFEQGGKDQKFIVNKWKKKKKQEWSMLHLETQIVYKFNWTSFKNVFVLILLHKENPK